MCSMTKLTVPVQCPHCRHEGPAFSYLLGQRSRCKMCNQVFQMPKHFRIACPECGVSLRVLLEMIGRDVVCKFCDHAFHIVSDPSRVRSASCRDQNATADPTPDRTREHAVSLTVEAALEAARAEVIRMEQERSEQAARLLSLEHALRRISGDHLGIHTSLEQLRVENETRARQDRDEIKELRTQLSRLEERHAAVVAGQDLMSSLAPLPGPTAQPSFPQHRASQNGHGRIPSLKPPQRTAPAGHSSAKTQVDRTTIREAIDRISYCELKADLLVTQLKTTKEARELDRQSFEQLLGKLQLELTQARNELARGNSRLSDQGRYPREEAAAIHE